MSVSKLKDFADDKINVTQNLKFILGMEENIFGKGENASYQHFLLFPKCFQKHPSLVCSLKIWDCVVKSFNEMDFFSNVLSRLFS